MTVYLVVKWRSHFISVTNQWIFYTEFECLYYELDVSNNNRIHGHENILNFKNIFIYITPYVKCCFTHASRAEIRIFTPRDIKFRTILVRKTFSWRVWLHHSPSARAANSNSQEKVLSHSYRNVLLYNRNVW